MFKAKYRGVHFKTQSYCYSDELKLVMQMCFPGLMKMREILLGIVTCIVSSYICLYCLLSSKAFFVDIYCQDECKIQATSLKERSLAREFGDKHVLLKLLKRVFERHPQFDAVDTILVDDSKYNSLNNK